MGIEAGLLVVRLDDVEAIGQGGTGDSTSPDDFAAFSHGYYDDDYTFVVMKSGRTYWVSNPFSELEAAFYGHQ